MDQSPEESEQGEDTPCRCPNCGQPSMVSSPGAYCMECEFEVQYFDDDGRIGR